MKFILLTCYVVAFVAIIPSNATSCNRTCGGRTVPFPFGFSGGCDIQLNCTPSGKILAAGLSVQSIDGATISIGLPAACQRPLAAIRRMFTGNFAPTSHNAILLRDCRNHTAVTDCFIPRTPVQTHFELMDCGDAGGNASITCYADAPNRTEFVDYRRLAGSGCRSLFSAISMEALENSSSVSLDVEIVRVGWWLRGGCRCSDHARCVKVSPPAEANVSAYRCECLEGFTGDGFLDGVGCRSACNPSNYMSRGTTRVVFLIGGAAVGAFLMVTTLCLVCKISKLTNRSRRSRQLYDTPGITIPIYPYKDMEKATDFFSEKRRLGCGAHGTVYSGWINGEWVAVKRLLLRHDPAGTTDQVLNEIRLVSSVSHPNLVRLLGCSLDHPDEHVLVYEFMPNGTLAHHLQSGQGQAGLPWPLRLTIAAETAAAVAHLHDSSFSRPPIYHRDVKSSNILLDAAWRAKVADFGLSRPGPEESYSHVSTAPQGTPGYVDPQYHQSFRLSDRSDVYSFGVVLAEIITGMRAVDLRRPREDVNLAAVAADRIGRGLLDEIVDPILKEEMMGDGWTREAVGRVAELAFRCLAWSGEMRPAMAEVARELEGIRVSRWIAAEMAAADLPPPCLSTSLLDNSCRRLNPAWVEGADSGDGGGEMVFSSENSRYDTWHSEGSSPSTTSLLTTTASVG